MKIVGGSFRDPSGFVFEREGVVFRKVMPSYMAHYRLFMDSGLYHELLKQELIVPHEEIPEDGSEGGLILRPEKVFISYPYEWCFSQLKDAALATLQIQKTALSHGMILKDASAYNIQFHRGRPVLIDTLSFEKDSDERPWAGYRQFCEHFLAPLALAAKNDIRCLELLKHNLDGIPLDLACRLLPKSSAFFPGLGLHLFAHSKMQKKHSDGAEGKHRLRMGRAQKEALTDHLSDVVRGLKWNVPATTWGDYYQTCSYSGDAVEGKKRIVEDILENLRSESVWDLGANTGFFSRLAAERKIPVLSMDFDPAAVEANYLQARKEKNAFLTPLLMDLRNPSGDCGWAGEERFSIFRRGPADTVLALALIHHLVIGNNVPLVKAAEFFSRICRRLIIEFVPKEDSQVKRLLANREDIFPEYNPAGFEKAFEGFFRIISRQDVQGTLRGIYCMEKK